MQIVKLRKVSNLMTVTLPSGFFDLTTATGKVQGISHGFCTTVQRVDAYTYQKGEVASPPSTPEGGWVSTSQF